jgi:uncharacterized sulfatase
MVRDKRYRYIRNYEPEKPYAQYMNTAEQGKTMIELRKSAPAGATQFMAAKKPPEELYDVAQDPHELRNLVNDPPHRAALERLRREHLRWSRDTRDLGLIPEPELLRREMELGSRYAILRQKDSASLMQRLRNPKANDPDPAVRYWAARRGANLTMDPVPIVRIAAAKSNKSLPVLIAGLEDPQEWTRLAAAQALDELGEAARPALEALRKCLARDQNRYVVRVVNRAVNQLTGGRHEVP